MDLEGKKYFGRKDIREKVPRVTKLGEGEDKSGKD